MDSCVFVFRWSSFTTDRRTMSNALQSPLISFDERAQPAKGRVPIIGNLIEVPAHVGESLRA